MMPATLCVATPTAAFTRVTLAPSILALGESSAARVQSVTAVWANPAGLHLGSKNTETSLSGAHIYQTQYTQFSLRHMIWGWGFGYGLRYADFGEVPEIRWSMATPSKILTPTGTQLTYQAYAHTLGISKKLSSHLSVGSRWTYIYERASHVKATGASLDVGVVVAPTRTWRIAVYTKNILNQAMTWTTPTQRQDKLPQDTTLGGYWELKRINMSFSLDASLKKQRDMYIKAGLQHDLTSQLCWRLGVNQTALHAGIGLRISNAQLNVAWVHQPQQRFSNRFQWGVSYG